MKYLALIFVSFFSQNLYAVDVTPNIALTPIINYLLSDSEQGFTLNSGTLDISFDTDGIVISNNALNLIADTNVLLQNELGNDIAVNDLDDIYVVGRLEEDYSPAGYISSFSYRMAIWKYKSDGTFDTNFGSNNGLAAYNAGDFSENTEGKSLVLDNSGNIYIVGQISDSRRDNPNLAIWKFDSQGNAVTTFGSNGVLFPCDATAYCYGYDIALDSLNNVIVTGSFNETQVPGISMGLWKFDNDGNPDTSFGINGLVTSTRSNPLVSDNDDGRAIVLDSTNNIYVAGRARGTETEGNDKLTLWKFDSNGNAVNSFGSDGIKSFGVDYLVFDLVLDDNGNIYMAGAYSGGSAVSSMFLTKHDNTGTLVSSFGVDGIVISDIAMSISQGYSILLDKRKNIFVSGVADVLSSGNYDMTIWKYDNNGSLDLSFNNDGIVTQTDASGMLNSFDKGVGMTLDSLGKLYVTGQSQNTDNNTDMVIWKYK